MKRIIGLIIFSSIVGVACQKTDQADLQPETQITDNKATNDKVGEDEESKKDERREKILALDLEPFRQDSFTALINKKYSLDEDYVPEDLRQVDVPLVFDNQEANQLRHQPADQLEAMFDAAQADGIELYARSGYRSYQTQVGLYQNYVTTYGQEEADRFSAKPGSSEHQSGLAMDITSAEVDYQLTTDFINHPSGQWLANHAHEFGFALRYPEGKEHITGYQYEPWHYRYFGEDVATYLYENQLTYEELVESYQKIVS